MSCETRVMRRTWCRRGAFVCGVIHILFASIASAADDGAKRNQDGSTSTPLPIGAVCRLEGAAQKSRREQFFPGWAFFFPTIDSSGRLMQSGMLGRRNACDHPTLQRMVTPIF